MQGEKGRGPMEISGQEKGAEQKEKREDSQFRDKEQGRKKRTGGGGISILFLTMN